MKLIKIAATVVVSLSLSGVAVAGKSRMARKAAPKKTATKENKSQLTTNSATTTTLKAVQKSAEGKNLNEHVNEYRRENRERLRLKINNSALSAEFKKFVA